MKLDKILLMVILTLFIITQWSSSVYLPAAPDIASALADHGGLIASSLSYYFLGFACGQFVWGSLADSVGFYPSQLASFAFYVIFAVLIACAQSAFAFTAFFTLSAVAVSANTTVGNAMVKDIYGPKAKVIIGYVGVALAVAPVLAPVIGSHLYTFLGWRSIFMFLALLSAVLLISFGYKFREYNRQARQNRASDQSKTLTRLKSTLSDVVFMNYVTILSVVFGVFFSLLLLTPYVLYAVTGFSAIQVGNIMFLGSASYILGALINVVLVARFKPEYAVKLGLLFLLIAVIIAGVDQFTVGLVTVWNLVAMSAFILGAGIIVPAAKGAAMVSRSEYIGMAAAIMKFGQAVSAAIMTRVTSWFLVRENVSPLIIIFMVVILLSAGLFLLVLRRSRSRLSLH